MTVLIPAPEHFEAAAAELRGNVSDTIELLQTILLNRGDPLYEQLIDMAREGLSLWRQAPTGRLIAAGMIMGVFAERARLRGGK